MEAATGLAEISCATMPAGAVMESHRCNAGCSADAIKGDLGRANDRENDLYRSLHTQGMDQIGAAAAAGKTDDDYLPRFALRVFLAAFFAVFFFIVFAAFLAAFLLEAFFLEVFLEVCLAFLATAFFDFLAAVFLTAFFAVLLLAFFATGFAVRLVAPRRCFRTGATAIGGTIIGSETRPSAASGT
jgi:hypothetical protein